MGDNMVMCVVGVGVCVILQPSYFRGLWLYRGHSGDGCDLALTLFKYDLLVLSWVRRVRQGSISSELLMCGGG